MTEKGGVILSNALDKHKLRLLNETLLVKQWLQVKTHTLVNFCRVTAKKLEADETISYI